MLRAPKQNTEITYHSSFSNHLRGKTIAITTSYSKPSPSADITEKLFRKYDSQKVTKLTRESKPHTLCPQVRYKALRSFTVHSCFHKTCPSQSVRHLTIESLFTGGDQKSLLSVFKEIAQYKNLRSLELRAHMSNILLENAYLNRQVKRLNHLQSLTLALTEVLFIRNSKHILDLKSLREIRILVTVSMQKVDQDEAVSFYIKLMRSKKLQFVELDTKYLVKKSSLMNALLKEIGQTSIPSFNISLASHSQDPINPDDLNYALDNADLFSISYHSNLGAHFTCTTPKAEKESLIQDKKKTLS